MALPPVSVRRDMIRAYAKSIGIDPDIAETVVRGEGLADDTWQSNLQQPYGREQSYGDFQLHFDPTGERPGLGNEFVQQTGLDVSDPANWFEMNKFAMDKARDIGWGPWMGAAKAGITGMMGIGQEPAPTYAQAGSYSAGEYVPTFDYTPPPGLLDADISPSQAEPTMMDSMESFGPTAGKILAAATKKKKASAVPPPQAVVLQPLKRYTVKGSI